MVGHSVFAVANERNVMAARKTSKKVAHKSITVSCGKIKANPWNPNKQSEFMFQKEKASIIEFGFVDPCTVRTHPTKSGFYEILDGEHRWRAAVELGYEAIEVVDLGVISDAKAKALTDILNNLHGEADPTLRAQLLKQVLDEEDKLREVLPYGKDELDTLLQASSFDWSSLDPKNAKQDGGSDGDSGWVGMKVSLTPEQHAKVSHCIGLVKNKLETESDAEAITAICVTYLSKL